MTDQISSVMALLDAMQAALEQRGPNGVRGAGSVSTLRGAAPGPPVP
ncbi:hypothetical protein [Aestuariimicrobium ganziense]|nr:hypothetical protein [Aestuariimicrobium ganziense]